MTASLGIAVFVKQSIWILGCAAFVYIAFGYMIWTTLENVGSTEKGSGFNLLLTPSRWRRNGVSFTTGIGAYLFSMLFAVVWMAFVLVSMTLLHVGTFAAAHNPATLAFPQIHPLSIVPILLIFVILPITCVHRALMRRAGVSHVPTHPVLHVDRMIWSGVVICGIFFYLGIRGLVMHLPFPFGQMLISTLALMLTTGIAACELTFMDEHAYGMALAPQRRYELSRPLGKRDHTNRVS